MKKFLALSTFLFLLGTAPAVSAAYTCLGGGDHSGADWTPSTDCASGEVAGTHTNIGTLYVNAGQTVSVKAYDGANYGSVNISATTATIANTGTFTANSRGNAAASGSGAGGSYTGGSQSGGGGGYGGTGSSSTKAGGITYGSLTAPVDLGSGGGNGADGAGTGGAGGGAIRITTTGTLTISGTVTANGANGGAAGSNNGGGGSGGSIYLTAATLAGAGSVTANGGNGGNGGGTAGGGGGGGRIALYFTASNTFSGTPTTNFGTGGTAAADNKSYGTAFIEDTTNSDITIPTNNGSWSASDRSSWKFRDLTINGHIFFQPTSATLLTISSSRTTTIASSVTITLGGTYTTDSNGKGVYLDLTGNVTLPATSTITADGKGYAGGSAGNPGSGTGGGTFTQCCGFTSDGGGGGYGGTGKNDTDSGSGGGTTYGSSTAPTDLGSGGAGGNGGSGSAGGGAIRITTTGTFTISGTITANGPNANSGAGAGGSIYATASSLAGSGSITTNGGNGGNGGGGGGGGRIAIYYTTSNTYSGTPTATMGTGGSGGANGTVTGPSLVYAPATPSSLVQYQTNCTTTIATGGNLESTTGCFKASLSDTDNPDTLYLEVEAKAIGTTFNDIVSAQGSGTAYSGSPVTASVSVSSGISLGTSYHWQARAVDTYGAKSAWVSYGGNAESAADFASAIPAPTSVTNTYISDTQINIAWTDNSSQETGFQVERNTDSGGYSLIYTTAANAQTYSDTSTSANHQYQYRVRATDGSNYSDYGTASSATYTTPAAPTGAGISQTAVGTITITWTDASGYESNFEVQRQIGAGSWVSVTTSVAAAATSYADTTVQQNATYTYRVRATRTSPNALNSAFSTSSGLAISQGAGHGVYITSSGRLIVENDAMGEVNVWTQIQNDTTDQTGAEVTYDESNPANGPVFTSAPVLHDLTVREGVSLADSTSDVIYAAADSGLVAIHENTATPASGAIKHYTSSYITEALIGNIQGMWGFNSSLADSSVKAANLSAAGATISYPTGVRGTGINITVAPATATVATLPTNYSLGLWVKETDGWHHYVKTDAGQYKDGNLQAASFTDRMTWVSTTITITAGTQDVDEAFATASTLTANQIRLLYQSGLRALQNHSTSRVTGISGADSYQKLQGSVNPVYAVAADAAAQYLYVGTNDTTTNTGALTVLGIDSDSVVDLYSTANTAKTDSAGTSFAGNDILALSVAGNPNPAFRGESDKSASSGLISIIGTNDTATRLWIEGQTYSLGQVLAAAVGPGSVKDTLNVNQVFRVGNSENTSLSPTPGLEVTQQGTVTQNYLGSDTNATAVSFSSSTLTSGSLLSLTNSNLTGTSTSLYIKHYATGSGNLAFRVDDVAGDTTPFTIDGDGNVGMGGAASVSGILNLASSLGTQAMATLTIGNSTTGNIVLANATTATSILASGTSGIFDWWQRNSGAISPTNITDDLILGATATSSAKFSISGTTGNASTSGSLTFDTTGTIQTTRDQTLTLGGNTTGNIILTNSVFMSSSATISGTLSLAPKLQVDAGTCNAGSAGKQYYDATNTKYYYCNGTNWFPVGETSGQISAFATACPSGWTEYTAARGRTVVGTPSGGTIAGTVGTALTNQQSITRTTSSSGSSNGSSGGGFPDTTFAPVHTHTVDVTMPYIQLTYCQKDTGSDLAEWIGSNTDISAATIVSTDPLASEKVIPSTIPYDPHVVGIVATKPGWLIGDQDTGGVQMALAGRVPTRVSLSNGDIKIGDAITTSDIPGVGMKATKPGWIIGKAMQDLTGDPGTVGTITVFLDPVWQDGVGEENLQAKIASVSAELAQLRLTPETTNWQYSTASGKLAAALPIQVPELTVTGKLTVGLLAFDDLASSISSLTGTITVKGDLAVTGSLHVLGSSAGTAVIPAGAIQLPVSSDLVSSASAIFATPQKIAVPVSTESTESGKFILRLPYTLPQDLKVKWWIVN